MKNQEEYIKFGTKKANGRLVFFTGKSGDYWVTIIPSLNVSGYGLSESESLDDADYNLRVFIKDLISLPKGLMDAELSKLGWNKNKIFNKQYSSVYVDENGVLQNFDSPEQVKRTIQETVNI